MAEERADIVVTDKVDDNVEKKLRSIGTASEKSFTSVQKLKGALADINTSAVTKLQAAMASNTNAIARELNAMVKLEAARSKNAVADAKAATETQRLATETARTEKAQLQAAQAAASAAKAQLALSDAQARATARATAAAAASSKAAIGEAQQGDAVARARAQFEAGEISIRKYIAAIQAKNAAETSGVAASERTVAAGTKVRSQNANIIAQLQDIGVSLAGGQNPLLVLIQQGSQLSYIASTMQGGVKALTMSILGMLAPFAAAAAVVGVLYAAFRIWQNELNDQANLKEYAKTLGLTAKEMKELKDVHVTSGDVIGGVWDTIKEAMNLEENFSALKGWAKSAVDFIMRVLKNFAFGMVGLFTGMFEMMKQLWTNLPAIVMDQVLTTANGVIDAINWVAKQSNEIIGTNFGQVDRLNNKYAGSAVGAWKATANAALKGFQDAENGYNRFVDRAGQYADKRARDRIKKQADLIKEKRPDGPKPTKQANPKTRDDFLNDTNKKLDDELSRMRMLKDEREAQQRLDQIEEEFAKRRQPLTQQEIAGFRAKIKAIQDYKYVQSEMDRIYEASVAPQRTLNASVEAATDLYDRGAIRLDTYNRELNKATEAYRQATNPLNAMEEAVAAAERANGKYGVALEQANYLEQIRVALKAQGIPLYDAETGKINEQAAALIKRNDALRASQTITNTVGAIVSPISENATMLANKQAYYDELNRMADEFNLSEAQRAQAKYALDAKFNEMRLSNYSSMFGQLANLSQSGNKKLAAIGKAAAVAQALIDGYAAVQKALASAPPPLNFAMAAVVGMQTGMNVSKILSTNVGSFQGGGQFMVDGRSGVDANNINMNVTRGERVTIETAAQQRANDNGTSAGPTPVSVKSINLFDEKSFLAAFDSDEGDIIMTNIIRRNASDYAAILGSAQ